MNRIFRRRRRANTHNIVIRSHDIQSKHQFDIDIHTNILTVSRIFQEFCLGEVHVIFAQYTKNRLEATVSFNENIAVKNLTRKGLLFNHTVFIPDTNVSILII